LLGNADQQKAFLELPASFTFRDAVRAYGKSDKPTADFLAKCVDVAIIRKVARGQYLKV
jgi:hypothetical protein